MAGLPWNQWQPSAGIGGRLGLEYAGQSLQQVLSSLDQYLESEQWQQQKQQMQQSLARMDQATRDAVTRIEADMEILARDLNQTAEAATERLVERYETLSRRLEQQIAEMAKSGHDDVLVPLQEFLHSLAQAMEQNREQR